MAEKATLDGIMKELQTIKKLVLKDLQIDMEDVELDKKRLRFNKKPFEDTKKIFDDVREWSMHIWDDCKNKKVIQKKTEFTYHCKLLKKNCKFEHCPLNIKRQ